MTDLIDRQAAIDGIKKEMLERDGRFFKGLLVANHVIVHLPSAQAFEDTINRKQAIEAFEPEHNKDWYTPTIIEVLEALPPAQPQRKSGQLLYHHTENIDEVKTADVYFCSSCKKEVLKKIRFGMFSGELDIQYDYCPHCGADVRGENDE